MKCENVPISESCASSDVKPLTITRLLLKSECGDLLMSDIVDRGDPSIRVPYRILHPHPPWPTRDGGKVVLSIINALGEMDRDATTISTISRRRVADCIESVLARDEGDFRRRNMIR